MQKILLSIASYYPAEQNVFHLFYKLKSFLLYEYIAEIYLKKQIKAFDKKDWKIWVWINKLTETKR